MSRSWYFSFICKMLLKYGCDLYGKNRLFLQGMYLQLQRMENSHHRKQQIFHVQASPTTSILRQSSSNSKAGWLKGSNPPPCTSTGKDPSYMNIVLPFLILPERPVVFQQVAVVAGKTLSTWSKTVQLADSPFQALVGAFAMWALCYWFCIDIPVDFIRRNAKARTISCLCGRQMTGHIRHILDELKLASYIQHLVHSLTQVIVNFRFFHVFVPDTLYEGRWTQQLAHAIFLPNF